MSIYSLPGTPASSYRVLFRFPHPVHVGLILKSLDMLLGGFLVGPHVLQGGGLARIHSCLLGGWRETVCSSYNLQIPIRRDQSTTLTNFVYFFLHKVMGGWESKSWNGSLIFFTFPLQVHFDLTVCCFCLVLRALSWQNCRHKGLRDLLRFPPFKWN